MAAPRGKRLSAKTSNNRPGTTAARAVTTHAATGSTAAALARRGAVFGPITLLILRPAATWTQARAGCIAPGNDGGPTPGVESRGSAVRVT